jgi:uncharacterized protein YecE (DUF72 family)
MEQKANIMSTSLYIGTAGWAYPHWNGVVFPKPHPAARHPLELLAASFNTVEINSSFYQPLKPEVVKLWIKKVQSNPRFKFTAKLHQQFTHARMIEDAEVTAFKAGLRPLQNSGKFGALLMQFPWSFRFTVENREFLIRLRRAFSEFPLVAEMRHSSWLAEEAVGTFLDYRIGFCNIDQPDYTRAMPPTAFLTSSVGYIRLHGRNPKNSLGGFNPSAPRLRQHDYLYSEAELSEWAQRIERVAKFSDATFVIFNNDAEAKSVVNALQLQKTVTGILAAAPYTLRRKFPVELENFGPRQAEQQYLFPAA